MFEYVKQGWPTWGSRAPRGFLPKKTGALCQFINCYTLGLFANYKFLYFGAPSTWMFINIFIDTQRMQGLVLVKGKNQRKMEKNENI